MLDSLLESAQPEANKALQEIYNAEDRNHALLAVAAFEKTYGAKFPKAVKKITDDIDELLAFSWSDRSCSSMFRVPAGSLIAECQGELMAEALVLLGKSPVARDHQRLPPGGLPSARMPGRVRLRQPARPAAA